MEHMEQYIAGFFDGEGNVNKFKAKGRFYYQVRIYQAGERGKRLLEEFQTFLGYGKIYVRKARFGQHQDVWELFIGSKKNILDFKNRIGKLCILKTFPSDAELVNLHLKKLFG